MLKQIIIITIILVILLAFIPAIQRYFIYFPAKNTPNRAQFAANDMQGITLRTVDDLTLHAWYKPPADHKPVILFLPGNAGHRGYRMPLIRPFLSAGFGVLLLDYRGYGGNPGRPSEQGLYQDGRAGVRFLQAQHHKMVIYGESLGSGVATQLATEFPSCALVLQSPYTSMKALQRYHYPWLPAVLKDRYDSLQRMQAIHCPILVLHGKLDRIVPYQQGETLFEGANQPKKLQSFPEQGHNNLWSKAFVHDVMTFVEQHCVDELSVGS
ncbi:MAG: alpha/beta fold hydrolase [Gammaproteobacteria bacterium]|nr:alpha/beta fold hydrolase [Gammaproteobacteria bacterium]